MKKIKNLTIKVLMVLMMVGFGITQTFSQTPTWAFAKSAGGTNNGDNNILSSKADNFGNVYVTGYFKSNTIVFDTITLTNDATDGSMDIFLVKYDTSGNVIWAKSYGGTKDDYAESITTDVSGNIYLTGTFQSDSVIFDTDTLIRNNNIDYSVFIVKINSSGGVIWARNSKGNSVFADGQSSSITIDVFNDIYITGYFSRGDDSVLSNIIFDTITLTNTGGYNIFIVKYDSSGNVIWANNEGVGESFSITTDIIGSIYTVGYFNNMFVVKYDSSGNIIWFKTQNGIVQPNAMSIDNAGNIYVVGNFENIIVFDTITLTSNGYTDIFIVKYDSSGNVIWARNAGTPNSDNAYSITVDNSNNIYVTGYFERDSINFGSYTLINYDTVGTADIFVVKYDSSGHVIWAKSAGGALDDKANSITVDIDGNIYVSGYFQSQTIVFDSTTLYYNGMTGNVFFAKLNNITNTTGIKTQQNNVLCSFFQNYNTMNIKIDVTGNYLVNVYSIIGRKTASYKINQDLIINLSDLSSGVYFVEVVNQDFTCKTTKKFEVIK
jgi:hypothetical protein